MKGKHTVLGLVWSVVPAMVLFLLLAWAVVGAMQSTAASSQAEGLRIAEQSIRRAVVQCYAIEGRYPQDLEYLSHNYGLAIDEEKYVVHYEIFASNLYPQITVLPR